MPAVTAIDLLRGLAKVSRADAELSRKIGAGCRIGVPHVAPDACLILQAAGSEARDWRAAMLLTGAFGAIELMQAPRVLRMLTGIDFSDQASAEPAQWQWLQAAICARLAGTPFAAVDGLAVMAGATQGQIDDATSITLRLTLRSGGHAVLTHARGAAADWLRLMAGANWQPERAAVGTLDHLALTLPVRLARHTLPAGALRSLRAGDVIVPASAAFDCAGAGWLEWGGRHVQVRYQAPGNLIILALENHVGNEHWQQALERERAAQHQGLSAASAASAADEDQYDDQDAQYHGQDRVQDDRQDDSQDDSQDNEQYEPQDSAEPDHGLLAEEAGDPATDVALEQLPVTLSFELGQVALNLGALRRLTAGTTLLLDGGGPAAIAIISGGRRIGSGEAVDVEGRLGVRIVAWGDA